ncbi:MAG: ATP-binding protein [Planctomycetota bacterium]
MPKLRFVEEYKSISSFEDLELPEFTVVTGINGCGKTQLLEAILHGRIAVDSIESQNIMLRVSSNLTESRNSNPAPQQVSRERYLVVKQFLSNAKRIRDKFVADLEKEGVAWVNAKDDRDLALIMGNGDEVYQRLKLHLKIDDGAAIREPQWVAYVRLRKALIEEYKSQVLGIRNIHPLVGPASDRYGKHPLAFTRGEVEDMIPLGWEQYDVFQHDLSRLFGSYYAALEENQYERFRNEKRGEANTCITDEEFVVKHGEPPWDFFNRLLAEVRLNYEVDPPSERPDASYSAVLRNRSNGVEISYENLSSGEKVLLGFVFCLYNVNKGKEKIQYPELILLDEIDAPLHPKMTKDMLDIVSRVLVEEKGIPVIMTTHSPSTVALSPEESLRMLEPSPHRLLPCTTEAAVRSLSDGYIAVMPGARFVITEAEIDKVFYTAAAEKMAEAGKMGGQPALVFIQATDGRNRQGGGRAQVESWGVKLKEAGLSNIYGIIDRDESNVPVGNVKVLPRYSIENYWLDPIITYAVLMHDGEHRNLIDVGIENQNYFQLSELDDSALQSISDAVCAKVLERNASLATGDSARESRYLNGRVVSVPAWLFDVRGKDLKNAFLNTFQYLVRNSYHLTANDCERSRQMLLEKLPGFLPEDLLDVFKSVQEA